MSDWQIVALELFLLIILGAALNYNSGPDAPEWSDRAVVLLALLTILFPFLVAAQAPQPAWFWPPDLVLLVISVTIPLFLHFIAKYRSDEAGTYWGPARVIFMAGLIIGLISIGLRSFLA